MWPNTQLQKTTDQTTIQPTIHTQRGTLKLTSVYAGKLKKSDELMFCHECEYPAENIYDLGEHMFEYQYEWSIQPCVTILHSL